MTEAGGLIGNYTGEANFMDQKECMAANPRIYGQLVPVLSKYSKFATVAQKTEVSNANAEDAAPAASSDADAE